jgi:hypothetical protein
VVLTALGVSRSRLLRKALTESVILSVSGGALGMLFARAGVEALVRAYPTSLPRIGGVAVNPSVILISLAIAVVCGLLFGLAPMMHTRSGAVAETLQSRGSSGTPRHHVRRALVIAETALTVIVVVGAGLLLRTVHNLTAVDTGFNRSRMVTFSITLPRASFDILGRVRAYRRLLEQLRAAPGVLDASAMTALPLDRQLLVNQTAITNNAAKSGPTIPIDYQRVMSGFFVTTGIPILQGRGFESPDIASKGGVAVVNETLANRRLGPQPADRVAAFRCAADGQHNPGHRDFDDYGGFGRRMWTAGMACVVRRPDGRAPVRVAIENSSNRSLGRVQTSADYAGCRVHRAEPPEAARGSEDASRFLSRNFQTRRHESRCSSVSSGFHDPGITRRSNMCPPGGSSYTIVSAS